MIRGYEKYFRFTCFCFLFSVSLESNSQQIIPVELVSFPGEFEFALSGNMAGNMKSEDPSLKNNNKDARGQILFDANLTKNFYASIRINAINSRELRGNDTTDLSTLAFSHNDYRFNFSFGGRKEKEPFFYGFFSDYSISSMQYYDVSNPDYRGVEITAHKINLGVKMDWKADWDQNLIISTAVKINNMWIEGAYGKGMVVYSALGAGNNEILLLNYYGFSFKTIIQLNHMAVYCETQTNYQYNKGHAIPGFVNHTFYSIGFETTSQAILKKREEKSKNPEDALENPQM